MGRFTAMPLEEEAKVAECVHNGKIELEFNVEQYVTSNYLKNQFKRDRPD